MIPTAAESVRMHNGRPRRVTMLAVVRHLRLSARFYLTLDRLPLTRSALADVLETTEDFAIRRATWAAHILHEEGTLLNPTRIRARANLNREQFESPRVRAAIDTIIETI